MTLHSNGSAPLNLEKGKLDPPQTRKRATKFIWHDVVHVGDLGHRIELAKLGSQNLQQHDKSVAKLRVAFTVLALIGSDLLSHLLVAGLVLPAGLVAPSDRNNDRHFDDFLEEDKHTDIVENTIPHIQDYYRKQVLVTETEEPLLPTNRTKTTTRHGTQCVENFFSDIAQVVNTTDPSYVKLVLRNMGLEESFLVRVAMDDLLQAPQDKLIWLQETGTCYRDATVLAHLCNSFEATLGPKPDYSSPNHRVLLTYFYNTHVVLETLTSRATKDLAFLSELSLQMLDRRETAEHHYDYSITDPDMKEFLKMKYQGVAQVFHAATIALGQSQNFPLRHGFQVNILEAVKLEAQIGHHQNARVGIALAAAIPFEPNVKNHEVRWKLGSDWVHAYEAWNMAFVVGSININRLIKLMIPSISCVSDDGEGFIAPRVISLALALMHIFPQADMPSQHLDIGLDLHHLETIRKFYDDAMGDFQTNYLTAHAMGESNFYHALLPSPSRNTVEHMLFNLCNGNCHNAKWRMAKSTPQSLLIGDDKDFSTHVAAIVWFTALMVGNGLELFFFLKLWQEGWSRQQQRLWWVAQFCFPIFAITTLGLAAFRNFMALPVLVFGLWKSGMPDAISYVYLAIYNECRSAKKDQPQERSSVLLHQIADWSNATGLLIHHSAATMPIVLMLTGAATLDRCIIDPILILCLQHSFSLIRYVSVSAHCLLELFLEVWFEWTVFSEFMALRSVHWGLALAAALMLLCHWMFLFSGAVELLHSLQSLEPQNAMPRTESGSVLEEETSRCVCGREAEIEKIHYFDV